MRKISFSLVRMIISPEQSSKIFSLFFLLFFMSVPSHAQERQMRNPDVVIGELIKVIPSLKDYKTPAGFHAPITRNKEGIIGMKEELEGREVTDYGSHDGPDPVVQRNTAGKITSPNSPSPIPSTPSVITQNFGGLGYTGVSPADPNMCAGPNDIIQIINNNSSSYFKIWDRNGNVLLNQTLVVNLVAGSGYVGQGDPVAMYDQLADRFVITEFGHTSGSNPNTLIAMVSQTADPLGAWYIYKFTDATFFCDYPKWSAWPNAYYAATNDFNTTGTTFLGCSVYAFNRTKMLAGDATAEEQRFRLTTLNFGIFPVNISGPTPPPAGSPGMFMYYSDDDFTVDPNDKDSLGIVTFLPNFAVPANTVLTFSQSMMTAPFKSDFCGNRNCVPSASGNGYDGLADRIMNRVIYRNFGTYEAIVLNYTVDANVGIGSPQAGIRWYELRRNGGLWSIFQQSTYAPAGSDWRWMGSICVNSKGQIALGFDLSSPTKYASVFFTGRNSTDALNTMSVQEQSIKNGTNYGTFGNRWGDYNEVTTDIVNDSLFWMTSMYGNTASAWATQIAQFKIGDCDALNSAFTLTQNAPAVPESQNIVYTNTINNTGCVPMSNFLLTDTLPTNVTFVSATNGGTYNAGNRVVSWPVNITAGLSQTYVFTVNINAGSYFAPVTLLNEPIAGPGIPAGWAATIGTGPTNWVVSSTLNHSPPSSMFGADNATAITDMRFSSTTPLALGVPTSKLTFWHNYNTESGWDGGVVEISTNGGTTWTDLGPLMTINGYNNSVGGTNPIAGRPAFSGNSGGFIQTTVSLLPYANQNALFRFRMTSDDNTAATGWYVDDINISSVAQVNMRSSLFNGVGIRQSFHDTITLILPPSGCTGQSVTSQPSNITTCAGTSASFTVGTAGTPPITYQWQESINGGVNWNNITNGGIYSGATTVTLTLNPVTIGMNNYQYRCVVNGCVAAVNSNSAILNVAALSVGGTVTPANTSICGTTNTGTLTLSGQTGSVIRWESATVLAGPYTTVLPSNTTTTLIYTNLPVTTYFRTVVQIPGCAAVNSSVATVTIIPGGLPMSIVSDVGTTLCVGDPATLTAMEGGGIIPATANCSSSNTVTTGNSVACTYGAPNFYHAANSYWRAFPLALAGPFTVNSVTFGVERSVTPTTQPIIVRLYTNTGAAFPGGTLTQVATQTYNLATQNNTLFTATLTIPPTVAGNATLVIEVNSPDGLAGTNSFFIGSNASAQTCTSYISAASCGINNPTDVGAIGFPNMHIVLFVNGTVPGAGTIVTTGTFLWSPAAGLNSTTTNPVAASPAVTTTYTVTNNNGAGCIRTASITLTVNQRPVVTAQPANVTLCSTNSASFSITATGTGITYQWQVSTNGGVTYSNLANGAPYSGVTTATLTINPATVALSGNRYRCVVSGVCPSGLGTPNISNGAILTVIALPTVTVSPAGPICGGLAGTNGILLTASGANTYTWSPAAGLYTDAAATNPYVAGSNAATVYAAPTVNTVYTVTGTSIATGCSGTASVTVNYTPAAPIVTPPSVTMCLGDAAVPLTISSSLAPVTLTLCSGTINLAVPDNTANGVSNIITVAGIPANATISSATVILDMSHTYPGDMIFNLKSPNGLILNLYKYSSGQFTGPVSGNPTWGWYGAKVGSLGTAAWSTIATAPFIYNNTTAWKPDAINTAVAGAVIQNPTGFVSNASSFASLYTTGASANGGWTLAMCDGGPGDVGTLQDWCLVLTYGIPSTGIWTPNGAGSGLFTDPAATIPYTGTQLQTVYVRPLVSTTYSITVSTGTCTSAPRLVPVTVNVPVVITAQPVNATVCTNKVAAFTVTVTGTSPSYQWQESINGGATFANITNGGVYSGATTATLTLTAPPVSMNGYMYRCAIAGVLPCPTVFSATRLLTVNPLPIVVISASPYQKLFPGLTTVLSATSTPAAAIYNWLKNGALVATTATYTVDIDHLGDYTLTVTDINGCVSTSNHVLISDSLSSRVFIYPNPNSGVFFVRYDPDHSSVTPFGLNVYDALGKRIYSQIYPLGAPYAAMKVDMSNFSTGMYSIEVTDVDGNRLGIGRVEMLR